MKNKILSITPVSHIKGVEKKLLKIGDVVQLDNPNIYDVKKHIKDANAIFTNPNKSNIYIGKTLIDCAKNLQFICTASTGLNHIDIQYAKKNKIRIISLTEERKVINKISSTAELAFTLMLCSLRKLNEASKSVLNGEWDYLPYVGKQVDHLKIGIIGYGRLGKLFARYCNSFGADIYIFDPYKSVKIKKFKQVDTLKKLVIMSDVISLHVHVSNETLGMIDKNILNFAKSDLLLINTSRGDIINEEDIIQFLVKNKNARIAVDVIANEINTKKDSILIKYAKESNQVLITPHIGGMTIHAQQIAYNHAANLLYNAFQNLNTNEP